MPGLGQPQTGTRASTPKICNIKGDDAAKVIYKNMGNNHNYPVMWADTITVVSGATTAVVASGIGFHGMTVASDATVIATPDGDLGTYYINKDTANNVVTFVCSSAAGAGGTAVNVMVMLGTDPDMASLACRGNTGAQQSLP